MNIYELFFGHIRHFVAAHDEQEAYQIGTDPERFPDLHFRPFDIKKVEVEGYTITVIPNETHVQENVTRKGGRPRKVAS